MIKTGKTLFVIFLMSLVASCNPLGKEKAKVTFFNPGSFQDLKLAVNSVSVQNNQLIITGSKLSTIKTATLKNNSQTETFEVESASDSQLITNGVKNISLLAGSVFDLVLSDAYGSATFQVSFTLANGSVTAAMLNNMGAMAGQVLKYDGLKWKPVYQIETQAFIGTWDASNNIGGSPDLSVVSSTSGDYYVATVAGTLNGVAYAIGDWIISDGYNWNKIPSSKTSVTSFQSRKGIVTLQPSDYVSLIDGASHKVTGSALKDIADIDFTTTPTNGQTIKWNTATSKWLPADDLTGTSGITRMDLSVTAPLSYNSTTGVFGISDATTTTSGSLSGADKTKLDGLTAIPAADGLLEKFSGVVAMKTCAAGETLIWYSVTGWTCTPGLLLSGSQVQTIGMDRNTTANTAGNNLVVQASGATTAATDKTGGTLTLSGGTATGTGTSAIQFQTSTAGASGTSDNAPSTKMTILGNGNVGIGTTNPSARFDLGSGSGGVGFLFQDEQQKIISSGYETGIQYFYGATQKGYTSSNASGFRVDSTSSSVPLILNNSGGNVGIGTTTPTSSLHLSGSNTGSGIFETIQNTVAGGYGAYTLYKNASQSWAVGMLNNATITRYSIYDATNTAERVSVLNNGNIGIGTIAPAYKLDVNGALNATSMNIGGVAFSPSSNSTSVATTGGQVQSITQTATNAATVARSALVLQNSGTGGNTYEFNLIGKNAAGTTTSFIDQAGDASFAASVIAPLYYGGASASGNITIDSTSNATKGNILLAPSGGKVGIGVSTPSNMLSIAGVNSTTNYTTSNASGVLSILDTTSPSTIGVGPSIVFGSKYYTGSSTMAAAAIGSYKENAPSNGTDEYNHSLVFKTNNYTTGVSERMRITSTGNVGIGTTAPATKLDVNAADSSGITIRNSAESTDTLQLFNAGGATTSRRAVIQGWRDTVGAVPLTLQESGGNVGIGTSTPGNKFSIETNSATSVEASGDNIQLRVQNTNNFGYSGMAINRSTTSRAAGTYHQTAGTTDWFAGVGYNAGVANSTYSIGPNFNLSSAKFVVTTSGNVGIGTTAPDNILDVSKSTSGGVGGIAQITNPATGTAGNAVELRFAPSAAHGSRYASIQGIDLDGNNKINLAFLTGAGASITEKMRIDQNGNVGIGSTAPGYPLTINGDVSIASANVLRFGATSICTSAGCTAPSDKRLKENIKPLVGTLNKILKLQGVEFDYINKKQFTDKHQIGVIAQEVEKIYPEVVTTDSKTGFKAVAYDHLIAPVIEAVKALYNRIMGIESHQSNQDREIASLKTENAQLKSRLERIEKILEKKK
jgi:hypothetical protein